MGEPERKKVIMMMMYPPIAELMKRTDSRYSLVIAVAKRARELSEGAEPLVKCASDKEVTEAVYELYYDKMRVVTPSGSAEEQPVTEELRQEDEHTAEE